MKVKSLIKFFYQKFLLYRAKSNLNIALNTSDITSNIILTAIHKTCSNHLFKHHIKYIDIENRRNNLLNDKSSIDFIDFGAGTSNSKRTEQDMYNGIKGTSRISKIASASKSLFWSSLLHDLVNNIQPKKLLELGTCFGISGSYIASACEGKYEFLTLEGSPEIAKIAKRTFEISGHNKVQVIIGPFHKTFHESLDHLQNVDFLFNDGHHDEKAVIDNFLISLPFFNENAIMVCDDINWSTGMKKAWNSIIQHPKVVSSYDLYTLGIVVISKNDHLIKKNYNFKII